MKEQFLQIEQAVNILNQALNAAASKGVFSLKDASLIHGSLEMVNSYFTKVQPGATQDSQPEVEDHTESQVSE